MDTVAFPTRGIPETGPFSERVGRVMGAVWSLGLPCLSLPLCSLPWYHLFAYIPRKHLDGTSLYSRVKYSISTSLCHQNGSPDPPMRITGNYLWNWWLTSRCKAMQLVTPMFRRGS